MRSRHAIKPTNYHTKPFTTIDKEYELKKYKKDAVKVAEDFKYDKTVIKAIDEAKSVEQVARILRTARHDKFDKKERTKRK